MKKPNYRLFSNSNSSWGWRLVSLREELKTAVKTHARITDYMVARGYYHPHHLGEDINVRLQDVDTVLNLK